MRIATSFLLLGVVLCVAAPVGAQEVIAGLDFLATQAGSQTFGGPYAIPPDFFAPGSEPFTGTIAYYGEPLGSFPGCPGPIDPTDTIVRRLSNAVFPGGETIPIELVQLSLVSVNPITVTYSGGPPELWDVRVTLPTPQPGTMTIAKTHPNGGVFSAQFNVRPVFIFTRVSDSSVRQFVPDPQPLQLAPLGSPWAYTPDPSILVIPGCTTNFFPGVIPFAAVQSALPPMSIKLAGPFTDIDLLLTTAPATATRASTWGRIKTIYR